MSTSKSRPAGPKCPICKSPAVHEQRPFCSKRCKDVDLARWLGGGYAIAGGNSDADEDGDGQPARDIERPSKTTEFDG